LGAEVKDDVKTESKWEKYLKNIKKTQWFDCNTTFQYSYKLSGKITGNDFLYCKFPFSCINSSDNNTTYFIWY
jgi:hypothetical protein